MHSALSSVTASPQTHLIESERLTLNPFTPKDFHDYKRLEQHPEVAKTTFTGLRTDEQVLAEFQQCQKDFETHGVSNLCVREKESGAFVGRIGLELKQMDKSRPPQFELRVALMPEFWGKGYAFEGSKAIVEYGLYTLKLPRVVVSHWASNKASEKVIKRLGFRYLYDLPAEREPIPYYEIED